MSQSTDILSLLSVSLLAILPAFGWILAGAVVRQMLPGSAALFKRGDVFTFYVGMPVVLFFSASRLDVSTLGASGGMWAGSLAILLMLAGAYGYARWRGFSLPHCGVFAQNAYRANLAIIGLALCASAFGEAGLVAAAMLIAVWTVLFNILAVLLLNATHGSSRSPAAVVKALTTNPLIASIVLGLLVGSLPWSMPQALYRAGSLWAQLAIPLALLCLGASINLRSVRESGGELAAACVWRLLIGPLLTVGLCLLFGVRGTELGVVFLLLGGPAAVACHVMVAAVGGNARLAASMVVVTTLLAPFTLTLGLFALRLGGVI